ncbi:hypothetical protein [Latilactobacillus phage TMW 1.1393 P1]|nr:hypothetical protein [Latilactobacillus phage TMW 1.1393 P1]
MPEILATDPRYKAFAVPQMFQEAG